MFEELGYAEPPPGWDDDSGAPEFDLDALRAREPWAWRHFEHTPEDDLLLVLDRETAAYLAAQPPPQTERVYGEADMALHQRDPDTYTDAEAITRLIQIEKDIAEAHALRAHLVALIAAHRPAAADRPAGQPGARAAVEADVVVEAVD
nr:hypothetical protein [Geodermatophilaceae bacterium]